jgi:hypothetical protein
MHPRIYAAILLAVLLLGSAIYLTGQIILRRSGEILSPETLIASQRATDGIFFGFALAPGNYKLAAYAWRKPDIVILGSSRAHNEHQEFYRLASYTMSGIVFSPEDALETLELLLPLHKPKIVIYELDFISLCTQSASAASQTSFPRPHGHPAYGWEWSYTNQFTVVPRLIIQGALPIRVAADIALGRFDAMPNGIQMYGLDSIILKRGFRLDGALMNVYGQISSPEAIADALNEVKTGTKHFLSGCYYNPAAMANLVMLRQELDRAGIALVVLLPPIAPTVYRRFIEAAPANTLYYRTWLQREATKPFPGLYDFLDGATIGALDSEFGDAVHGGDVSEARMLLKAADDSNGIMKDIINRPFLDRIVREHHGEWLLPMAYFRAADAPGGDAKGPVNVTQ